MKQSNSISSPRHKLDQCDQSLEATNIQETCAKPNRMHNICKCHGEMRGDVSFANELEPYN